MSPGHPQPCPGDRAAASLDEDKVEIVAGTLAIHASSPGVERGFCAACGTSLSYARANRPGLFDVTTASLELAGAGCPAARRPVRGTGRPANPEAFPPAKEIWTSERLSWEAANPHLPQFARFSPPAAPPAGD